MERPENISYVPTPENIRDKYQYFTEAEMGKLDPPMPPRQAVPFGLYACSPLQAS